MLLSWVGCSQPSFRSGQTFPSSRSTPPGRTTPSIGSAVTWRCGYLVSEGPSVKWKRSNDGCRYSRRHLPFAIPVPLAKGIPAESYPWHWSIYRWLEGENATTERIADPHEAATALARFVAAVQRIDPAEGPPSGSQNEFRGSPLAMRDPSTRAAIATLQSTLDADAVTSAWEAALQIPPWHGPAVWLHGDLHPENLLAQQGQISAVIDFGLLAVGDPACDAMVAWWFFTAESRVTERCRLAISTLIAAPTSDKSAAHRSLSCSGVNEVRFQLRTSPIRIATVHLPQPGTRAYAIQRGPSRGRSVGSQAPGRRRIRRCGWPVRVVRQLLLPTGSSDHPQ